MSQQLPPNTSWRSTVAQSVRNLQVREIAKVLANIEPGASTGSKLRLAMQFEDTIFKSSDSLEDYHKRLAKRLKKAQKSYVPVNKNNNDDNNENNSATAKREQELNKLKALYGQAVLFILDNSEKAVAEMKIKYGDEKAQQLKMHTDSVQNWASDLGITKTANSNTGAANDGDTNNTGSSAKPNLLMSNEHYEKLVQHLERRVDNIRSHVVKLAHPDKFLLETLESTERDLSNNNNNNNSNDKSSNSSTNSSTGSTHPKAGRVLAVTTRKRYERLQTNIGGNKSNNTTTDAIALFHTAFAQAQADVPVPTRRQQQQDNSISSTNKAALVHVQKLRAAAATVVAYVMVEDKTTLPYPILSKLQQITQDSIPIVQAAVKEHYKANQDTVLSLQHAWLKSDELLMKCKGAPRSLTPPPAKRPRIVVSPRVLLTPGRKTPPHLLPALRRKRAILIRPPRNGQGSYLTLTFEKAFGMTIYFSPLVVAIRAYKDRIDDTNHSRQNGLDRTSISQCATWTPLNDGLIPDQINQRESNKLKSVSPLNKPTVDASAPTFSVWGVEGPYEAVGPLVEERLRDASAIATHALRKCFANAAADKSGSNDFEIEIREATALLEFLQVARTTYIPDWQDDES